MQHHAQFFYVYAHANWTQQVVDFPGGTVKFIPELRFISESPHERIPCYRVLDDNGEPTVGSNFVQVSHPPTQHSIIFACPQGKYIEMKLMNINNIGQ